MLQALFLACIVYTVASYLGNISCCPAEAASELSGAQYLALK